MLTSAEVNSFHLHQPKPEGALRIALSSRRAAGDLIRRPVAPDR
jgi:hypothetical protein